VTAPFRRHTDENLRFSSTESVARFLPGGRYRTSAHCTPYPYLQRQGRYMGELILFKIPKI